MEQSEIQKIVETAVRVSLTRKKMTLKRAVALIEKIEEKAESMDLAVVIAVANDSGNMVAVHAMDHAFLASYEIAVNKAYTSAGLKMSTAELGELSQPGKELYGIQQTNQGRIVIFGGGEPLKDGSGQVIGALGVSGGTLEQDTGLAAYGSKIWKEGMEWL